MRRYVVVGACCAAVVGCGGNSTKGFRPVSVQQQSAVNGTKPFEAPQMAITFQYPAGFRALRINKIVSTAGNTKNSSIAAVGTDGADFLAVSRTPIPAGVNPGNIRQGLPTFDQLMTHLSGQPAKGKALVIDGAAAIAYPRVHVPGLAGVATRVTFLFVGTDRYEFQCQATKSGVATIEKACDQMLSTLKISQ
jgi:hypothetical protein